MDMSQLPREEESLKKIKNLEKLSPLEFDVTQRDKTEAPFSGKYNDFNKKGIYVDIVSGEALFSSEDKFDSTCGWPSFSKSIKDDNIIKKEDRSHGMDRTEVRSKIADSHLGHLFNDGPNGANRYCINSAALKFIPFKDLEKEGYSKYLNLFK